MKKEVNEKNYRILIKMLYISMVAQNFANELPKCIFKQKIKGTGNMFMSALGNYEESIYGILDHTIMEKLDENQNYLHDLIDFQLSLSNNQLTYFIEDLEKLKQKYE